MWLSSLQADGLSLPTMQTSSLGDGPGQGEGRPQSSLQVPGEKHSCYPGGVGNDLAWREEGAYLQEESSRGATKQLPHGLGAVLQISSLKVWLRLSLQVFGMLSGPYTSPTQGQTVLNESLSSGFARWPRVGRRLRWAHRGAAKDSRRKRGVSGHYPGLTQGTRNGREEEGNAL